ncbi:MAG: hypothetical protein WCO56_29220 [Verrucomicrobiota bacterium]
MEQNIAEKGDASELVLDGHLLGENPTELSLAELLSIAEAEFNPDTNTISEETLLKEWPSLRTQLSEAQRIWDTPALLELPSTHSPVIPAPALITTSAMVVIPAAIEEPDWRMLIAGIA